MQQTSLAFHELSFVPEGDEVMVGRRETDSYALFPPDGADLLRRLVGGMPPGDAAAWYEETYGESVNIDGFLATVDDLGFVRNGSDDVAPPAMPSDRSWASRLGRATFSPVAWLCYAALLAVAVTTMVRDPGTRPWRGNEFYVHSLALVELTYIFGQIPGLLWHEGFHVLAGRRLGLPARLRIDVRLYFVVFESQLVGILSQPRSRRYLPYLAGIVADLIWFSTLTIVGAVCVPLGGGVGLVGRLALALAFPTVFRLIWQLWVVVRTDLYYVFATLLGCVDLQAATQARLRNAWWRVLGRRDRLVDMSRWSGRDARLSRWYAPLAFAMTTFLILIALNLLIPVMTSIVKASLREAQSAHGFDLAYLDFVVSLSLAILPFFVVAAIWVRKFSRMRRAARPSLAITAPGRPS